jgi:3-oxoacyl-[acyl-carrier protein] reductase
VDLKLKDRVVLIAGSTRGIGKATACAFLAEGCRVVITGRDEDSLAQAKQELTERFDPQHVMACAGDLTQLSVIRPTLAEIDQRWGQLDCLVANIGTGRGTPGWNLTEEDWQTLFEANLWGTVRLVTAAMSKMIVRQQGSIVLVSSIVGLESTPAPLPYSAAKAALLNMGKNLARQAGPFQVRVNCVAPGNVLFPGGSWERHLAARKTEVEQYIATEVPLRRFGRPEEIADAIVFLCSERAAFITGACIVADGGQTRSI